MEANIPAIESANVWGLVGLKKGGKRKQHKFLKELRQTTTPIEAVDDVTSSKQSRRIAYRGVKRQTTLWKGPVMQNRLADQLIFPLNDTAIKVTNSEEARKSRVREHITEVKKQTGTLAGKLYSAIYQGVEKAPAKPTVDAETARILRKTLLETINKRRKERFLLAQVASRGKQQNKIKSRNFHRHKKRRLLKEFEVETERLREENPKAFVERIQDAEMQRAKERAGLRHREGSKFAKLQKLRAKYDNEARTAVSEMYEKSHELRKRTGADDSSEESDLDISSESEPESDESELHNDVSASDEEDEEEEEKNSLLWWREPSVKDTSEPQANKSSRPTVLSTLAAETVLDNSIGSRAPMPSITCEAIGTAATVITAEPEADIMDPGTDEVFFRTLEETCAADRSLQEQFDREKEDVVDEETLKDADPFMPGWNAWTGPGTEEQDEVRRQQRIIPAPKVERKDADKSHVIIRRRLNSDFKKHLVKSIPFPYNTPEQFEAVIAQPVSREWTTAAVHRELTRPKITTQAGRIIRPLSKSAALLRDRDVERLAKQTKDV